MYKIDLTLIPLLLYHHNNSINNKMVSQERLFAFYNTKWVLTINIVSLVIGIYNLSYDEVHILLKVNIKHRLTSNIFKAPLAKWATCCLSELLLVWNHTFVKGIACVSIEKIWAPLYY